jgi:CBS domain-containing protein
MSRKPETVQPGDTLEAAARKMRECEVGILPVLEGGELRGVLTDRDIVVRAIAQGLDPASARVHQAMTDQAYCCWEDEPLAEARLKMEVRAVRRLVVLDTSGRLIGLISLDDLASVSEGQAGEVLERVTAPEDPSGFFSG